MHVVYRCTCRQNTPIHTIIIIKIKFLKEVYVFAFILFLILFLILLSADVSERKLEQYYTVLTIKDIIKNEITLGISTLSNMLIFQLQNIQITI